MQLHWVGDAEKNEKNKDKEKTQAENLGTQDLPCLCHQRRKLRFFFPRFVFVMVGVGFSFEFQFLGSKITSYGRENICIEFEVRGRNVFLCFFWK